MSTTENDRASEGDLATVRRANERAPAYLLNLPGGKSHAWSCIALHDRLSRNSKSHIRLRS